MSADNIERPEVAWARRILAAIPTARAADLAVELVNENGYGGRLILRTLKEETL